MKPRCTPQFTQWLNKSHTASSEPWQQHIWVYTTPTSYVTLHVALITICLRHPTLGYCLCLLGSYFPRMFTLGGEFILRVFYPPEKISGGSSYPVTPEHRSNLAFVWEFNTPIYIIYSCEFTTVPQHACTPVSSLCKMPL